ncbi:MAG: DUF5320 domain-containing protein [Thermoplasmata archaeon]|nr:DUF5320 domain-containing protein [Thermoplasmata archaeon]
MENLSNRPDFLIQQKEIVLNQIEEHKIEIKILENQLELIKKELGE